MGANRIYGIMKEYSLVAENLMDIISDKKNLDEYFLI